MAPRSFTSPRLWRWAPVGVVVVAAACGLGAGSTPPTDGVGGGGPPPGAVGAGPAVTSGDGVATGGGDGRAELWWFTARSGGMTTTFRTDADVFGLPARNAGTYESVTFAQGKDLFNSSLAARGLGPLGNADSCLGCHRGHGSGTVPGGDSDRLEGGAVTDPGLLVRLSVPGVDGHGAPVPEPTYGDQIQDRAFPGADPAGAPPVGEARVHVRYEPVTGSFGDGTPYTLRRPVVSLTDLSAGPLDPATLLSARLAPPVIGLGLLEAIPESVVVAGADPEDRDGDGVSGRPNRVWDRGRGEVALGRFGWKAGQPNIDQQTEAALLGDLGVTSPLYPAADGSTELSVTAAYPLIFYSKVLAVPAVRNVDDFEARAGAALFAGAGCASCHTTAFRTGPATITSLADQTIHPYTDLLLHDMGPGLADGRPEYEASGTEWRTPPLWGLGRRKQVTGVVVLLHDGRARSMAEAILWHGGEAEAARERFRTMSGADRAALVRFLESL